MGEYGDLSFPCPLCGATIEDDGIPHYYRCDKVDGGCGAMFAKQPRCFFVGLYLLNRQGEIIGYIEKDKRRSIIKTNKILPDKPGWHNDT